MSFRLGGGKTKSSTTATENFNRTTTPDVPSWLQESVGGLNHRIQSLAAYDPYALVPGANPLQEQAAAGASGLANGYEFLSGIQGADAPSVAAESVLTNLDSYMSPYRQQVTDAAMSDFDAAAGKTRAQQALDMAGSGAFGGSGAAITQALTEGELSRARNTSLANLLDQQFRTGAGLSSEDAARRQAAGTANAQFELQNLQRLGQLGLDTQASRRADLEAQFSIGDAMRGIEAEEAQAPFSLADWAINAFAGINPSQYFGQTETGTSTQQGTSKGKNSSFGLGFGMSDIGKIIAGLG